MLKMGQKWAKPVKKTILYVRRFAGVEPGIFFGAAYGWALEAS